MNAAKTPGIKQVVIKIISKEATKVIKPVRPLGELRYQQSQCFT